MIGRRERWGYAAGDIGFNLTWQSIELYLFYFYVEELRLPLGVAAGIFLAGAAADWLADPLIGALADRSGPDRPLRLWVVASGPLIAVALALAFVVPPFAATGTAAWALATHLALRFAYGGGNIPYAALTARMTRDPAEHTRLTGARMQGAAIGGLVAALVYALVAREGGTAHFALGAAILGGLAQPCFVATWATVRERVVPRVAPAPLSLRRELAGYAGLIATSAALRRVLATIIAAGLSTTVTGKAILFLFDRDLGAERWGYAATLLPSLALLLTTPLWVGLAARRGRPAMLVAAALLHAGAIAALAGLAGTGVAPALALLGVAVAASSGMSVMFWSLVPDAIRDLEDTAAATGCAARVYAVATTARKLGQAVAPQVIALSLALTGGADAARRGGSVLPGMVAAALLCVVTVVLYRPRDATAPPPPSDD